MPFDTAVEALDMTLAIALILVISISLTPCREWHTFTAAQGHRCSPRRFAARHRVICLHQGLGVKIRSLQMTVPQVSEILRIVVWVRALQESHSQCSLFSLRVILASQDITVILLRDGVRRCIIGDTDSNFIHDCDMSDKQFVVSLQRHSIALFERVKRGLDAHKLVFLVPCLLE